MPSGVDTIWHLAVCTAVLALPERLALGGIGVIACYCRVSSARQKTDSQKPEIRRWLQGHGIDLSTVEWFEDK
jgi:hypothetical protein